MALGDISWGAVFNQSGVSKGALAREKIFSAEWFSHSSWLKAARLKFMLFDIAQ